MTDVAPRMVPQPNALNRPYWTGGANGELLIQHCTKCGHWNHPPAASCPVCGGEVRAEAVRGTGTVYTFTVNHHPFNPTVPVPFVIALVELDEQADLRVVTDIVNCEPDAVSIGMPVRVLFEQHGEVFVPLFEPA